ncbi:MAG: hypothetical protein HIU83_03325 [Proteobacteria bacterium]|nr:hypothetical protein [Pseudomonadota bacterium]
MTEQVMQSESKSKEVLKPVLRLRRNGSSLDNEDGIVLIIVLITLLLLSILGTTLLDSTTSELKITGNSHNNQVAFYSADAALQFAETYSQIYLSLNGNTTTWPAAGGHSLNSNFAEGVATGTSYNVITLPNNSTVQVKVEFVGSGNLPPGYGTQEDSSLGGSTSFKANYFVSTAIATEPNNSSATIEAQIAKVVPQ